MRTIKSVNVIRRSVGRPKKKVDVLGWDSIAVALSEILALCRFRGTKADHVRFYYEGQRSYLKTQALKIVNMIETLEEQEKEQV